jgi:hypothetical protein
MKRAKRIQHDKQRDGRFPRRQGYAGQASSASRAYSPVGPRTFTGFTSFGPASPEL